MKENPDCPLYLGLDTSAYTTSLALVDGDENIVFESRIPLPVKEGSLGLRQSEAVFSHLLNMPRLWEAGNRLGGGRKLYAVAFSARPRPVSGSYMPVFKVGEAFGLFLARTMGLYYLATSHQEGHIMAGLWSAGLGPGRYLVLHLSGGTTEIIASEETGPGQLELECLGGTSDLNAGQFVDRVGLAMGLSFPAGPQLEMLARGGTEGNLKLPVAVKGGTVSFSGPASQAERLLARGCSRENLSRAVENCIADTLGLAVRNLAKECGPFNGLLAVGGVTANQYIRERLGKNLGEWGLYYAAPSFAGDNAVGPAVQAARRLGATGSKSSH